MATTCRSIRSSSTSFAIAFGVLYCVVAEYATRGSRLAGAAFGFLVWVVFHLIVMLAMRTVPAPWDQPLEHFSECFWTYSLDVEHRDRATRSAQPGSHTSPIRGCCWALTGGMS